MVVNSSGRLVRYGATVALVILTSLLAVAIVPWLEEAVFLLFLAAVVAASWYGGLGPGLTAAVGSAIVRHCPIIGPHPVDRLDGLTVLRATTFAILGALAALLAERCRRASSEGRLRRASEELEERARQRTDELARINDSLQQEIRRRARAEGKLQAERARLEAILNQMPSALVIAEAPSGRPVLHNEEVTRQVQEPLSPWGDVEEVARSGACHADGQPYEPDEYPLARALAGETVREEDIRYRCRDGDWIWQSVNAAPIRDRDGRIIAAVCVSLDVTQRRLAEAHRAELWGQLVAVEEQERSRLARELHDRMGQHLTALMLCLAAIEDPGRDEADRSDCLRRLHDLTGEIGGEVHRIAWELRPTALDDLGLQAAVAQYAEDWSAASRIAVEVQANDSGLGRLPAPIETTLYRIIQESLTNVAKHAQARRVRVVLGRRDRHVFAIVEDDGRGFDARAATGRAGAGGRLGLLGMKERASLAGGSLEVESAPGEGTIILTSIPLPPSLDGTAHHAGPGCEGRARHPTP